MWTMAEASSFPGQMRQSCVKPSPVRFIEVLNACTSVGVFENATEGHEYIIKRHRVSDISG
jgi:hypothetical protein